MSRTWSFHIAEMDCAEEVRALKAELLPLVGDERSLAFDLLRGKLTVTVEDEGLDRDTLASAIARTGMAARPWRAGGVGGTEDAPGRQRRARGLLVMAGILAGAAGYIVHGLRQGWVEAFAESAAAPPVSQVLYGAAVLAGLWFVLPKAWAALRRARADMHLLMTVAVLGALGLGEWLEAASVSLLFAVSLLLESWSVHRARRAVEALLALAPETARVVEQGGGVRERPVENVPEGSLVQVRPGDRIPLDGVVEAGRGAVDTAPITGESLPEAVQEGDEVFAGSINGEGELRIRTTRPAEQTTIARILRQVEAARSRRAAAERWVDRFARIYTPVMFALAVLVALAGFVFGGPLSGWLYRALVVLVIACPCALVISTPVSVVAALASASRAGVLVKGGALLEAPARLQAVALDKTGTLTHGRPELVELRVLADGLDRSRALALAAALERASSHPLAHAVLEAAEREEVEVPEGEGVEVLAGLGVRGRVQGASFGLGNRGLLEIEEVDADALFREVEQVQRAGATTTVLFDGDRRPLALFAFADRVREGSRQALDELRRVGIRHIALLTGDQVYPAGVAGREAGVDEVHARLLPLAKQEQVEALRDRYGSVAMVGDGINDAPAMAAASLSVSMGEVGTDVAIETSDVSLMSDDLGRLAWLIRHSRRMLATIRVNVAFALAAKAVFLGLAAVDLATLWMAIAADMGASLLVTVNSLRLLRARPEQK